MKLYCCTLFVLVLYVFMVIQSMYMTPRHVRTVTFGSDFMNVFVYPTTSVNTILHKISFQYNVQIHFLTMHVMENNHPLVHKRIQLHPTDTLHYYLNHTWWSIQVKPQPNERYYIYTLNAPTMTSEHVTCHADGICAITPSKQCHGLCINAFLLFQHKKRPNYVKIDNQTIPYSDDLWLPDSTVLYHFLLD